MGSSQTSTQNSTQTQTANPVAQQDITPIANLAPSIANTPYNTGMNQNVAGLTQNQLTGIGQGYNLMTNNPANPYIGAASQYAMMAADPNNVNALTQDYLSPYANNVMAQLQNVYGQQDAQLLGNQAASGAIGGSRSAVANSTLANQQTLGAGQTMAGLYQQALNAAQTTAGQQAGAAYSLGNLGNESLNTQLQGLNAGLQTGNLAQQQQQNQYNAATQNAVQSTLFPQQEAAAGMNIAQGAYGLGSTSTGQSQTTTPVNYLGMLLGAGAAGAGAYMQSDERVKTDIAPIGRSFDGDTIYRYRYDGDPTTRIGLMAQEVEKKHPDAVRTDAQGIKAVDYNKATAKSAEMGDKRLHRDLGGGVGIGSGASGLQGYSGLQNPLQAYQGLQDPLAQATQVQVNTPQAQFPQLNMGQGQGQNSAQQQQDALAKQYQGLGQALGKTNLGSTLGDWASPLTQTGYANDYGGEIDLPVSAAHGGRIHRDDGGSVQQELLGERELQALSGAHSPFEAHVSQPPALGSAFGGRIHRAGGGGTSDDDAAGEDIMDAFPDSGPTGFWSGIRNSLGLPSREGSAPQQPLATPRPLPGPVSQDVARREALEAQPNQASPAVTSSPWDTSASAATPPAQPANPDAIGDLIRSHGLTDSPMTQFIKERAAANQPQQPPSLTQPASLTPNAPQTFPSPAVTAAIGSPAQTPPPVAAPQPSAPQVSPAYYDRLRQSESGGNPNAQASTSSAYGPYQFTQATWHNEVVRRHPELGLTDQDRLNPAAQEKAIPVFTKDRQDALVRAGIDPNETNTKMAHFLGDTGAAQFLGALKANQQTPANTVASPAAVAANHNVFYNEDGTAKTVGEVYAAQNARPQPGAGQRQSPLQDPSLQPPKPGESYLDRTMKMLGMDVSKKSDLGDKLFNMGVGMMAAGPSVGVKGGAGAAISALNAAGKGGMYMNQQAQEQQKLDLQKQLHDAQIAKYQREAKQPQKIGTETIYDQFGMPHYRDKMGIPDPSAPDGWREVNAGGASNDASHTGGGELPATMEALQKSVSPSIWNEANAIVDYDRAPYVGRYSAPGTPGGKVMETARLLANLRGDEYNEATYNSKQAAQKDLTATVTSRQVSAGNSSMGHLYDLVKSADKRDPGDYPIFNRIGAMRREAAGSDVTKSYNENASLLAGELTSFYRAMGGAEQDIQRELKNLDPNLSLEQQRGVVGKAVELVRSKLDALETKRDFAFGKNGEKRFPILNDKARKQFAAVEEWAARDPEDRSPVRDFKAEAPTPAAVPPVGHIEGGYRFKGGDPGNKANWEKV